jgi:hypothetical protein
MLNMHIRLGGMAAAMASILAFRLSRELQRPGWF